MKLYGIRHKETGKYLCPHYDFGGSMYHFTWVDIFVDIQKNVWEFLDDEIPKLKDKVEIVEQDYVKPTIRVIG